MAALAGILWLFALFPWPPAAWVHQKGKARGELAELEERLADESPRTRAAAVREAARRGGRDAWELVLRALGDREPEVGDTAQLVLGELTDPAVAAELCGRSGLRSENEVVRARAAEALGRVQAEVDAGELAERLDVDGEGVSRLLVWSVERLARARRLSGDRDRLGRALARVQRSRRDPVLAADALLALQALEVPELQRLATGARSSSEPELRVAALAAARRAPLGECETWARALSSDREGAVRLEAIECLETLGTRGAAEALVERLEKEERQGIRCRVLDALQSLSGYKYRFDVRPWKEWLATCPLEWRAGPRALKPSAVESLTRAQGLSALEVQGDRVAFLFDFSGSMWMPLPDGRTPKEVVDVELRAALERLPETVEFNLVPYNQEPHPWQDAVVSAKKANVRAALDFFERCNLHGRGNVWDAMLVALADPAVDNIVVLTDGYPTGGRHADMELVAPLFGHANRYRKVRLDAVLVDANYRGSAQWSELARSTGGTCLEVALRR